MDVSNVSKSFSSDTYGKYAKLSLSTGAVKDTDFSKVTSNIEVSAGFDPTLLRRVVDQIKSTFNMLDTRLHFRVNMQANSVVVEVVDSKTNSVIRQIPSEEMQELKKKIEEMRGAFVDVKA